MSHFGLSENESAFLGANVSKDDSVWEWGTGGTTDFLRYRCKHLTSVEHNARYAAAAIESAAMWGKTPRSSVLFIPPDLPYVEGTDDDGDLTTFRSYVESYSGRGVDVVLVDGRARCECVRFAVERAPFGPHPGMKFLLHDADRPQYAPIFDMLQEVGRVERLALLKMRTP